MQAEDKKQKALETILKILQTRPGKITEEGVQRLAKIAG